MNKADRKIVFDKYGGRCAFCGADVSKGCHLWDIEPIRTMVGNDGGVTVINENVDNCLPACKSCESSRRKYGGMRKMTIEQFREDIKQQFEYLRSGGLTANSYGRSIRFGLIKETGIEVKFYFEQFENKSNETRG